MNPESRTALLLRLFRAAADGQPEPRTGHVAEDNELLTCWALGQLPPSRHADLIQHLSLCPPCREEVIEMIQAGVLVFEEVGEDALDTALIRQHQPVVYPARRLRRVGGWLVAVTAAAAALLLVLGWFSRVRGPDAELARVEQEIQTGQAQAGLDRLDRLLAGNLSAEARERAWQLQERAGYSVAREELEAGRFDRVQEVVGRVSAEGRMTSRLLNLRLQAERGIPAEIALAQAGALTDYGYQVDGTTSMALPVLNRTTERLDRELQEAVTANPQDLALLLNRGQFLLMMCHFKEAESQFATALQLDSQSMAAHLGRGLALYELKQYLAALADFEEAIRLETSSPAAYVNAAMCLEQLGRPEEAARQWERAQELTRDSTLRKKIEVHRQRTGGGK